MADDEAYWALRLLETSIQASGLSERQLEKRLGWEKGALGKVLRNGGALEHQQILDILEVLSRDGREGGARGAKGSPPAGPLVGTLLERFHRLGIPASETAFVGPPSPPPLQGAELERRVEDLLAEAFGHLEEIQDEED
ncbi:MAG TPA: hypothetical protein VEL74_06155 [Thermoanaerobaculia bacterium]|nr:hypothetical protein [Thermoanaerobaculia bacterium]